MPKRVTLMDVAKEAGCSVQSVSHTLSGNQAVRIPETTRQRIREAAEKVGYRPNRMAQAMKTGRSHVIGVWVSLDRPTNNSVRMLHAICERARQNEYDVMIIGLDRTMAYGAEGKPPNFWPVDGVIAIDSGKAINRFREDKTNDNVPVIVLGYEEFANADSVAWNVYECALETINRVIAAGRTDIVHLSPDWVIRDYPREQRRRGYTEAMQNAGLKPVILEVAGETSEAAEQAMRLYIAEKGLPETVFGFTDQIAIGATRALLSGGAKVPEDTWVIGFGDSPEASDCIIPLTTLKVPNAGILDQTWEWLMSRIENHQLPTRQAVIPMEIVERASCGRLD
ncbi:MAG: LacI family transcriptional regulator [Armatimonadetes bacterium]|nr:LacI family transcriptional regulator [Armatimonadota bacterium]